MIKIISATIAASVASHNLLAADLNPSDGYGIYNDYTQYVLAVSWQPGFCKTKSSNPPFECKNQLQKINPQDNLTVHGLWPGLPFSFSKKMQDADVYTKLTRWKKYGCAADPVKAEKAYVCGDVLKNNPELIADLVDYMPGANASTCLDAHEFQKHGACFNFEPAVYFGKMVDIVRQIRVSQLGVYIGSGYGKKVKKNDVKEIVDKAYGFQAKNSTIFSCGQQGSEYFLMEILFTLNKDKINAQLDSTSFDSLDPGNIETCPDEFLIPGI